MNESLTSIVTEAVTEAAPAGMSRQAALWAVVIMAAVTALLRFLPFWIFSGKRKTPRVVAYLGRVLPYALMGMLVVYCLRGVGFASLSGWLPALAASLCVVGLHVWRRNTLVSIVGGTAVYMILIRLL